MNLVLSPTFKKIILPALIIIYWLVFFFLDQEKLKVMEQGRKAQVEDIRAWMERERILVHTREEKILEPKPGPTIIIEERELSEFEEMEPYYLGDEGVRP